MTSTSVSTGRTWRFLARIAVTVILLTFIWRLVDSAEVMQALREVSWIWFAAAVVTLIAQTIFSAIRWRVTAAEIGSNLALTFAIREYFLSQIINQTVPGAITGDAARAVRSRHKGGLLNVGKAVAIERLAGQICLFLMLSTGFIVTLNTAGGLDWPIRVSRPLLGIVMFGLGVLATLVVLTALRGRSKRLRWTRPLHRALLARHVLPSQLLLGAAIAICNVYAFAFAAYSVGLDMSFAETTTLVPLVLFAMLVPLTISGWGLREGAAAFFLPIMGASVSLSVAASVMFGLAHLVSATPGVIVALKP
ncbi:MAG: lysylphosphatidylglycerol synthase transmembrane domain-containing protein [Pseudomonadota bacterium]